MYLFLYVFSYLFDFTLYAWGHFSCRVYWLLICYSWSPYSRFYPILKSDEVGFDVMFYYRLPLRMSPLTRNIGVSYAMPCFTNEIYNREMCLIRRYYMPGYVCSHEDRNQIYNTTPYKCKFALHSVICSNISPHFTPVQYTVSYIIGLLGRVGYFTRSFGRICHTAIQAYDRE